MIDNISLERGRNPRIELLGIEDRVVGVVARASVGWLMRLEFKVGSGGEGWREGRWGGVGWFYFAFLLLLLLLSLFASASASVSASASFALRKIDDEGFSGKRGYI